MELLSNQKVHQNIQKLKFKGGAKKELSILWFADLHFENPHTDKKNLKKIIDSNPTSYIIIGGDAFDLMESFGDPRQSKDRQRDMGVGSNYINHVLDEFIKFFSPYAKRILSINFGNHEGAFIKRHGFDLPEAAASILNNQYGANVVCGDYAGYISLSISRSGNGSWVSNTMYFTHSSGSIGKRSKGMLAIDILKGQHPSADTFLFEHDHEAFIKPEVVEKLSSSKTDLIDKHMWFVSVPTMKDEFGGVRRGFHHEKNMGKRVIGCAKLNFNVIRNRCVSTNEDSQRLNLKPELIII